jgi:hypothetical protein
VRSRPLPIVLRLYPPHLAGCKRKMRFPVPEVFSPGAARGQTEREGSRLLYNHSQCLPDFSKLPPTFCV